jgi:hypothetical protein
MMARLWRAIIGFAQLIRRQAFAQLDKAGPSASSRRFPQKLHIPPALVKRAGSIQHYRLPLHSLSLGKPCTKGRLWLPHFLSRANPAIS